MTLRIVITTTLLTGLVLGCGGGKVVTTYMTPREHLKYALDLFNRGKYLKATEEFTKVSLKHSGTDVADDAQFYLGECWYQQDDFVSATTEYERLVSNYPRSEYVEEAMYKIVICYNYLSPHYGLDQSFTLNAIRAAQNFLDLYRESEYLDEVDKIFQDLKWKLAKRMYTSAHIYLKLSEYYSAIIYYDRVILDFHDSPYAAKGKYWKGYCYFMLENYQKSQLILTDFIRKHPEEEELVSDAKDLLDEMNTEKKNRGTLTNIGEGSRTAN